MRFGKFDSKVTTVGMMLLALYGLAIGTLMLGIARGAARRP